MDKTTGYRGDIMSLNTFVTKWVVFVLVCCGCGCDSGGQNARTAAQNERVPTEAQIANLTYTGIYENQPVALRDGRYEGEPFVEGGASRPTVQWVDWFYGFGDLTGDGNDDAIVFLSETSGGSGTRLYIAVVSIQNGQAVNAGTAFVGDRPQVRSFDIADGKVQLDIVEQGPGDAACCPTQLAHKEWGLKDGSLVEVAAEITGSLSLEVLFETEWILTHFNIGEPVPAEPEMTITFEEGKIGGSAGCNRYFTAIEETAPGNIRIGVLAISQKTCPEAIAQTEYFYTLRLARINSYSFLMGNLALDWRSEDGWHGTLLYVPRPSTAPAP